MFASCLTLLVLFLSIQDATQQQHTSTTSTLRQRRIGRTNPRVDISPNDRQNGPGRDRDGVVRDHVGLITTQRCPNVGDDAISVGFGEMNLSNQYDGNLCVLYKINKQTGQILAPIARSYDQNSWQWSGGEAPDVVFQRATSQMKLNCDYTAHPRYVNTCFIKLPSQDESLNSEQEIDYVLKSYDHSLPDQKSIVAKFLEQATFGTRKEDIASWPFQLSMTYAMEEWMHKQMYEESLSSHREFYRKRTNPKATSVLAAGVPGPTPCEMYSRWRTYAFSIKDAKKDVMIELLNQNDLMYLLSVDGIPRTIVHDLALENEDLQEDGISVNIEDLLGVTLTICSGQFDEDSVGRDLSFLIDDECWYVVGGNPQVNLSYDESLFNYILDIDDANIESIDDESYLSSELFTEYRSNDEFIMTIPLHNTPHMGNLCTQLPNPHLFLDETGDPVTPVYARTMIDNEAAYLIYDPRLVLAENTVESPNPDGGGAITSETDGTALCANVPRSFLNEDYCYVSASESACSARTPPTFSITLDEETLVGLNAATGHYVYAIDNLPLNSTDGSHETYLRKPCDNGRGRVSRWLRVESTFCESDDYRTVTEGTEETLSFLLGLFYDPTDVTTNHDLRDIKLWNWVYCDEVDEDLYDLGYVKDNFGECWKHVHPLHYNVYDFTNWVENHPGGPGEITQFAEHDMAILYFPDSHHGDGNERFYTNIVANKNDYRLIGRFGDTIRYTSLPNELEDPEFAVTFGSVPSNPPSTGVVVCGSVGEVANDPMMGTVFDTRTFYYRKSGSAAYLDTTSSSAFTQQRNTIWSYLALYAKDQLRQRVAWALSQILVITPQLMTDADFTETTLNYYDIFVRNAFGNYRDVLKEISFSDRMGEMLSSEGSQSLQYNMDRRNIVAYPDENFAREIMQLFSLGLYTLNMDGSPVFDENGAKKQVYDNDDITSFARAWTGMYQQVDRGNVEARNTNIEPMGLSGEWRDHFPKNDLYDGYIGDGYELCVDQPTQQFLKKGATYRILGSRSNPELMDDPNDWEGDTEIIRYKLGINSELYNVLCDAPTPREACTFPSKVVLTENLNCVGEECNLDTLRTIQVASSPYPIFYEYIRPPCVEQAFFRFGRRVIDYTHSSYEARGMMCADIRRDVAAEACCMDGWQAVYDAEPCCESGWYYNLRDYGYGHRFCEYNGERMRYIRAQQRCRHNGMEQCDFSRINPYEGTCARDHWDRIYFHWTSSPCSIRAKVTVNGEIAIVHETEEDFRQIKNIRSHVNEYNINYFRVPWVDGVYPNARTGCDDLSSCYILEETCICDTTVVEEAVFQTVPSREDILSSLKIGAVDPEVSDIDYIDLVCDVSGVTVYSTSNDACDDLDMSSIFHVFDDNGIGHYLKNMQSMVYIGDYAFRNPVHFISLVDPETRDAYHETEAVLDHYFYHPNHPPFLASRMIQRFGISNPSPSYVEAVATTYKAGIYQGDGFEFGSGKYGDLGAMMAAILLHSDARSVALDADPSHGSLKEPLLKVIGYMRSMEYVHNAPLIHPLLGGLQNKIGQGSYEAQSVFSFFLPEYSPPGSVGNAGLVSPEAQVLGGSNVVNLVDGLFWLTKFGLNACNGDASLNSRVVRFSCGRDEGDYSRSVGHLTYSMERGMDVDDVVDELSLLLTSSRLNNSSRGVIKKAIRKYFYEQITQSGAVEPDYEQAIRIAQQLMLATPEFHGTNIVQSTDQTRKASAPTSGVDETYKVAIYLFFGGGMDSYNLLVPKDDCVDHDLYEQYKQVRGDVALDKSSLLDLDASRSSQPCNTFGVNSAIPILKDMYDTGDALFFANTGILQKITTKQTWNRDTQSELFGHNTQQRETKRIDITDEVRGSGILGRIFHVLSEKGYKADSTTIDSRSLALRGSPEASDMVTQLSSGSPSEFGRYPSTDSFIADLFDVNNSTTWDSSLFGDLWSSTLVQSINTNQKIISITDNPDYDVTTEFPDTRLARRFKAIASWIKARGERKVSRDAFYVDQGGYDLHAVTDTRTLELRLEEMNGALEAFKLEMEAQGLWENVVIMTGSDFGRTLTPNSGSGTDHAWGGNYAMMGGSVSGGKILGEYPSDLSEEGEFIIGRGRVIPTTPLDAAWLGVANWLGVTDDGDLDFVLPNRNSFDVCKLYTDQELFVDGTVPNPCTTLQPNVGDDNIIDTDHDGVPDNVDRCPQTPVSETSKRAKVDSFGCTLEEYLAAGCSSEVRLSNIRTSVYQPNSQGIADDFVRENILTAAEAESLLLEYDNCNTHSSSSTQRGQT